MSFPRITDGLGTVSTLDDRPNDTSGLTASELKAKFDKDPETLKAYINDIFIPYLESTAAAAQLGISTITGLSAETVQAALEQIMDTMQNISQGAVPNSSITLAKLAADVLAILNGKQPLTADLPVLSGVSMDDKIPIQDVSGNAGAAIDLYTLWRQLQRNITYGKTNVVMADGDNGFRIGLITTSNINSAAVTGEKIAAGAVQAAHIAKGAVTAQKLAADAVKLTFTNFTVGPGWFTTGSPYTDFPYQAGLTIANVTEDMIPEVIFNPTDAVSGNFAPVAKSINGGIFIYAAEPPSAAVTIPTILLWR